jgi:hypothetical protein
MPPLCRYRTAFEGTTKHSEILEEPFFSFEEYTAYREMYSQHLLIAYNELMMKPSVKDIELTNEVKPWFDELKHSHSMGWDDLSSENKWIMNLYGEELKSRFGALSIVDRSLLPSGVMKMLRQKKVTWQLILWD